MSTAFRAGFVLPFALLCSAAVAVAQPQQAPAPDIPSLTDPGEGLTIGHRSPDTGLARFAGGTGRGIRLALPASASPEARARQFATLYGAPFGISATDQLSVIRIEKDETVADAEHVRFRQMHQGVPVAGAEFLVHLRGERVTSAAGSIATRLPSSVIPATPPASALEAARALVADIATREPGPTFSEPRLEILDRSLLGERDGGEPRLTWFVEATGMELREFIWVDAQSGTVFHHLSQFTSLFRLVFSAGDRDELPGDLVRSEISVASGDPEADQAFDYLGATYRYFRDVHHRPIFTWLATDESTVHYGGTACPNARWTGTRVWFCDRFPNADDIVAHEWTHAITEFSANLLYSGESGALNESYSDIFGETVDQLTPTPASDGSSLDWKFGEAIGVRRDMKDPSRLGDPGSASDETVQCGPGDFGGVHSNSGIPNRAYVLMVSGGSGNGVSVAGIGLTKAARVEYRTLTKYLGQTSRFADNAVGLRQACADLIGVDFGDNETIQAADCENVARATAAVQMDLPLCRATTATFASWEYSGGAATADRTWVATYPEFDSTQVIVSQDGWNPAFVDPRPFGNENPFPPVPFPLRRIAPGQWVPQRTAFNRTSGSDMDPTYTATWATTFSFSASGILNGSMTFHDTGFFQEDGSFRGRSNRGYQWLIDLEARTASVSGYNDTRYRPSVLSQYSVNDVIRHNFAGSVALTFSTSSQYEPPPGAGSLTTFNATPNSDDSPSLSRILREAPPGEELAADGLSAILVVYRADTSDPVTLTVSQPAGAVDLGLTDYSDEGLTTPLGGRASQVTLAAPADDCPDDAPPGSHPCMFLALLWAPEKMIPQAPVGGNGAYLGVPVTLTATQGSNPSVTSTIQIVPPPLVLVGGVWDRVDTNWDAFNLWLDSRYPHGVIVKAEFDNATFGSTSQPAQTAFVSAASAALARARAQGIAARQVDAVAHGTGGTLVRCTLETAGSCNGGGSAPWPAYLKAYGPVHQVVFVGAPHLESPFMQDVLNHKDDTNGASHPLVNALCQGCTLSAALGRIAGAPLGPGSALDFTNVAGDASVNRPPGVTYRSIAGIAPAAGASVTADLLDIISQAYRGKSLSTQFGGQPHDTIVGRDSQRGSTQAGSVTYVDLPDLVHRSVDGNLAETQSEAVWLQAIRWLTETDALFPRPSPPPTPGLPRLTTLATPPMFDLSGYTQVAAGNLSVSPNGGTLYAHAVQTITASSNTKNLVQVLLFQQVDYPRDVPVRYDTEAPFELKVRVERLGTAAFTAIGIFDDMTFAAVPLSFTMAVPGGGPLQLTLANTPGTPLGVGATHAVRAEAFLTSGGTIDVTSLATFSARSGTGEVFTVGEGGTVTGAGPGFDWLDVSYGGLSASVLVRVDTCEYTLGPSGATGPAEGGDTQLLINATVGCTWRIEDDAAWATVAPASGAGNATLTVTMSENPGTSARYVWLTAGSQRVRVTQPGTGCTITAPAIPTFTSAGGTGQVALGAYSGCGFVAWVDAPWARATTTTGVVDYEVDANTSYSARTTTMRIGGLALTLRQEGVLPDFGPNLIQNGDFANGLTGWTTYATPDQSYIQASVTDGQLTFARVPPPAGTSNQATVFQNTGAPIAAGSTLRAEFSLGNSAAVRRRVSVLVLDANFSDLAVCTFWLPPSTPLAPYRLRMHTTRAWSNASIYFYAATAGTTGAYFVDDVSLRTEATGVVDRTECTDPVAPAPVAAVSGGSLLTNGDFSSGAMAPWSTYGQITSQIANGVFEFYRPAVTPAGVVLQSTGQPMAPGQIMRAMFQLGNTSSVRKRVTVLLHDLDFSDLSACTFWLPPGTPLSDYTMLSYATQSWANATLSVYPATVGAEAWLQFDNATLQRTSGAMTSGTDCLEPDGSALVGRVRESLEAGPDRGATEGQGVGRSRGVAEAPPQSAMGEWSSTGQGGWTMAGDSHTDTELMWPTVLEAVDGDAAILIDSSIDGLASWGEVLVQVNGHGWQSLGAVQATTSGSLLFPVDVRDGDRVELRLAFHVRPGADGSTERWTVNGVRLVLGGL